MDIWPDPSRHAGIGRPADKSRMHRSISLRPSLMRECTRMAKKDPPEVCHSDDQARRFASPLYQDRQETEAPHSPPRDKKQAKAGSAWTALETRAKRSKSADLTAEKKRRAAWKAWGKAAFQEWKKMLKADRTTPREKILRRLKKMNLGVSEKTLERAVDRWKDLAQRLRRFRCR